MSLASIYGAAALGLAAFFHPSTAGSPGEAPHDGTPGVFHPLTAPTIASVSPDTGPSLAGAAVTVRGTGFDFNTTVSFGGVPSLSVVAMDSMTLVATAPRHDPGVVDVTVARSDGSAFTLPASFTYTPGGGSSSATGGMETPPYDGPGEGCYCTTSGASGTDSSGFGGGVCLCTALFAVATRLCRRRS